MKTSKFILLWIVAGLIVYAVLGIGHTGVSTQPMRVVSDTTFVFNYPEEEIQALSTDRTRPDTMLAYRVMNKTKDTVYLTYTGKHR